MQYQRFIVLILYHTVNAAQQILLVISIAVVFTNSTDDIQHRNIISCRHLSIYSQTCCADTQQKQQRNHFDTVSFSFWL